MVAVVVMVVVSVVVTVVGTVVVTVVGTVVVTMVVTTEGGARGAASSSSRRSWWRSAVVELAPTTAAVPAPIPAVRAIAPAAKRTVALSGCRILKRTKLFSVVRDQ